MLLLEFTWSFRHDAQTRYNFARAAIQYRVQYNNFITCQSVVAGYREITNWGLTQDLNQNLDNKLTLINTRS